MKQLPPFSCHLLVASILLAVSSAPLSSLAQQSTGEEYSKPDAVIIVAGDPKRWSTKADLDLATVVAQVQQDKRKLIRLHGYAPISGSNSMSIALAEPVITAVRDRLQVLGISPARVQIINYGHRYAELRSQSSPWTEVFIIRANAAH